LTVSFEILGGAGRDRTDDLLNAIQALSQLSYSPTNSYITNTEPTVNSVPSTIDVELESEDLVRIRNPQEAIGSF
jgi:hypothetical protein